MADAAGEPLIEWLGRAESGPERLGGKAASLDRLARMGFSVPPGFCLTTAAFERQVRLVAGRAGASHEPRALASRLEEAPLAADLATELRASVQQLVADGDGAEPRFAVRSSAIGEDSSAASYAGLHETELGVEPAAVDAAVRRCWASLWSPEALAYRQFRGISTAGAAMAVVVQRLVPAAAAAVAFTRHPVTGRDDQLVITASPGLGDAMVSGTVTPDTYVVDRRSMAVVEFTPGETDRVLDDAGVRELADLCLRVEAGFGQAVDIEAAFADATWYLLQARPITTR